jgi:hypothetical protein
MRWLIGAVTGLFVLWSGYWVVGSRTVLENVQTWVAKAPKDGIPVKTGAITLAGYPNRFDLTVTDPQYADPVTGWSWKAPFVQALALSYKPWAVIVVLPNEQTVMRAEESIAVTSDGLRASMAVLPQSDLGFDNVILETDAAAMTSDLGWTISVKRSVIALRHDPTRAATYELGVQIGEFAPDPSLAARLAEMTDLPAVIDSVTADVFAGLSAPLDRNAGQTRPQVEQIEIKKILISWGPLAIYASGQIVPDADGLAKGRIAIEVTNWEHLVPLLVATGAIKPELSQTANNMMAAMAKSGPDQNVLTVPLVMADGWMTLGPFPLGPAPSLRAQPGF